MNPIVSCSLIFDCTNSNSEFDTLIVVSFFVILIVAIVGFIVSWFDNRK